METILQRKLRGREMHMIRRHDRNEIHPLALGHSRLLGDHLLKRSITAFGGQKQIPAAGFGLARATGERAADQLDLPVHVCGNTMHRADEGAATAADHSVTNFSAHDKKLTGD